MCSQSLSAQVPKDFDGSGKVCPTHPSSLNLSALQLQSDGTWGKGTRQGCAAGPEGALDEARQLGACAHCWSDLGRRKGPRLWNEAVVKPPCQSIQSLYQLYRYTVVTVLVVIFKRPFRWIPTVDLPVGFSTVH